MSVGVLSRTCLVCKKSKKISEFPKNGPYYRRTCSKCHNINRTKKYRTPTGYKSRIESGWRRRGVVFTVEQYEELYKQQQGQCAICSKTAPENGSALCVDHCHKTGVVRGLLCHRCNKALGVMNDSLDLITNAHQYLKRTK